MSQLYNSPPLIPETLSCVVKSCLAAMSGKAKRGPATRPPYELSNQPSVLLRRPHYPATLPTSLLSSTIIVANWLASVPQPHHSTHFQQAPLPLARPEGLSPRRTRRTISSHLSLLCIIALLQPAGQPYPCHCCAVVICCVRLPPARSVCLLTGTASGGWRLPRGSPPWCPGSCRSRWQRRPWCAGAQQPPRHWGTRNPWRPPAVTACGSAGRRRWPEPGPQTCRPQPRPPQWRC